MTHSGNEGRTRTIKDSLYAIVVGGSVLLCLGFLFAYLRWGRTQFPIDNNVLILLFGAIAIALSPWLSRLRIGGVFELELRHLGSELRKVKETLLRAEAVEDEHRMQFYIDNAGWRYRIPDQETARFLGSLKGPIAMSTEELEQYPLKGEMDSVRECDLLKTGPHIFAILNRKRYHVGMDDLFDWRRHHKEDWQEVDEEELRQYRTGR